MRTGFAIVGIALALSGCDQLFGSGNNNNKGSTDAGADAGPVDGGPDMAHYTGGDIPLGATVHRLLAGESANVPSGALAAYAVTWSNGSFLLQWTGPGGQPGTRFTGSVWTRGTFTAAVPGCGGGCAFGPTDYFSQATPVPSGGQRIDFDTAASANVLGLAFSVDTEPVYFELLVAGQPATQVTYYPDTDFGGQTNMPMEMPFGLTTQ